MLVWLLISVILVALIANDRYKLAECINWAFALVIAILLFALSLTKLPYILTHWGGPSYHVWSSLMVLSALLVLVAIGGLVQYLIDHWHWGERLIVRRR